MAKTDTPNVELAPITSKTDAVTNEGPLGHSESYYRSGAYLEDLDKYGLQEPEDVLAFFQSNEGKEIILGIIEQIIEEEELIEQIRVEGRKEELQKELLIAYLFYKALSAREAFADQQMEQQEIADHQQSQSEQNKSDYHAPPLSEANSSIYDTVENYLQKSLEQKYEATNSLEKDWGDLEKEVQKTTDQYNLFDEYLQEAAEMFNNILQTTSETPQEQTLESKIQLIEKQIASATTAMEEEASRISNELASRPIDESNIDEARKLLHTSNAMNVQIAALSEMLSVIKGKSDLYTKDGARTDSFTKAQYVLKREMKLVNEDGTLYLLRNDQNFDEMDAGDKAAAHQLFKDMKPELLVVKKLTERNKDLDQKEQKVRKTSLSGRSEKLQQDILLLANQITSLQSARAGAEASLAETPKNTPRPTPKPMKNNSVGVFKALGRLMQIASSHEAIQFVDEAASRSNPGLHSKMLHLRDHESLLKLEDEDSLSQLADAASMVSVVEEVNSLSMQPPKPLPMRAPVDAEDEIDSPAPYTSPSPFKLTPFK